MKILEQTFDWDKYQKCRYVFASEGEGCPTYLLVYASSAHPKALSGFPDGLGAALEGGLGFYGFKRLDAEEAMKIGVAVGGERPKERSVSVFQLPEGKSVSEALTELEKVRAPDLWPFSDEKMTAEDYDRHVPPPEFIRNVPPAALIEEPEVEEFNAMASKVAVFKK